VVYSSYASACVTGSGPPCPCSALAAVWRLGGGLVGATWAQARTQRRAHAHKSDQATLSGCRQVLVGRRSGARRRLAGGHAAAALEVEGEAGGARGAAT